jgi:hypothetical protein
MRHSLLLPAAWAAIFLALCRLPLAAQAQGQDTRHIIPAYNPRLDAVRPPSEFGTGKVWNVGPTREYQKPGDVASHVRDGDIVEIDAGVYRCDAGVRWRNSFLTLVGVGGRAILDNTGCGVPGGKGIWNPRGVGMVVANIEFLGAAVGDANGAGIRYDGSGYLYITNCYFHDNQDGILYTPETALETSDIVVDHSEFAHNGGGDGRAHNLYINRGHSLVMRFSYSHEAVVGHELKTRLPINYVLYNRFADEEDGNGSYQIDVPNGGLTYIIGNVIQKGPHNSNNNSISYEVEGPPNEVEKIYIANNTIIGQGGPVLHVYDSPQLSGRMINNLIVGAGPNIIDGSGAGKIVATNNIVSTTPGFYDQSRRSYYLTAHSVAVDKGVDPGSADGFPLTPLYEFVYPASAEPRPVVGPLDVGAYEYRPGQVIPTPPTITFASVSGTVGYDATATLHWTTTGATTCSASGAWSGGPPTSGSFMTAKLRSNKTYTLYCSGPGGSVSQSVKIVVNESAQAAALGTYKWREIPNSTFETVCAEKWKDNKGNYIYADIFGNYYGPLCNTKSAHTTNVYVPETQTVYYMGGFTPRNTTDGNETYGFNVALLKPQLITLPTHINQTREWVGKPNQETPFNIPVCGTILHLMDGTVVPAVRGIDGQAAYYPKTKKIIVGPGGISPGGLHDCAPNPGEAAGVPEDQWEFDPLAANPLPAPVQKVWKLIAEPDQRFGDVYGGVPTWVLDPATGIAFYADNYNYRERGGFLIDYNTTPPRVKLVNNIYPFDNIGQGIVDTVNHYALMAGGGQFAIWNFNGLSLDAYGTNGSPGTTGVVGGPEPLFTTQPDWGAHGNTDAVNGPLSVTYNPKLRAWVGWDLGSTLYFFFPDYEQKTINIVAKNDIAGGPKGDPTAASITYIPDHDVYVVNAGWGSNFYLLSPPEEGTALQAQAAEATAGPSKKRKTAQ